MSQRVEPCTPIFLRCSGGGLLGSGQRPGGRSSGATGTRVTAEPKQVGRRPGPPT